MWIYSPYDQTGDNSSPGDTAGVRPFDFLILFPSAAAQAGQIYRQYQQTQSQTHRRNTGQEDQRLPNRVKHGADGQTKQEVEKPLMLIHLTSVMQCKTKLIKLQHFLNHHYCLLVSKRKKVRKKCLNKIYISWIK